MNKTKTPINLNDKVDKEAELGTLIVVLLKARNLNDKHSFRKSDVFAQATLNGAQKRTHVDIKGGQRPEWDGEVRFTIMKGTAPKHRKLEVACYSQEPRSEDLMGQGVVDITETLRTGEFDDWVPLEVDGVKRGELYLEMTYYANAPAPVAAAPAANKQLSALLNQNNLSRHPSKLSPADRLSRPQQTGRLQGQTTDLAYGQAHSAPGSRISSNAPSPSFRPHEPQYTPQSTGGQGSNPKTNALPASLVPTHPASAGSSPKGRHDALPTNDPYGAYPGRRRQESQANAQQSQGAAPLPSTLRPGPASSSTPPSKFAGPQPVDHTQGQGQAHGQGRGHVRHLSSPPQDIYSKYGQDDTPSSNPYIGGGASPQNPYIGGNTTPPSNHANPYIGGNASPLSISTNPYFGGSASPPNNPANPYTGGNVLPANSGLGSDRAYSVAPPLAGPSPSAAQAQGGSYSGYGSPPPSGPPLLWQQNTLGGAPTSNGSFSFPMPMVSPTQERPQQQQSFSAYSEQNMGYGQHQQQQYHQHRPPMHKASSSSRDEQFDPYLQARYQSPLPLPPGASSSSSGGAAPSRPAPPTPATTAPTPAQAAPATRAPTPPQKVSTPGPDRARLEALRRVEEEASRRREQELKDLELAMQLDRELNLAEERATATAGGESNMPGRWQ